MIDIRRSVRDRLVRVVHDALAPQVADQTREFEAVVRRETDRLAQLVADVEFRARRDVHAAGERDASRDSGRFVREHLPTTPSFPHPQETLLHALAAAPSDGMALEFGVFSGSTLKTIAAERGGREVYGFDSFQGLPEDWRTNIPAGAFDVDRIPEVDGAELVVGWFSDTVPGFVRDHAGPVAFLHLDADLYSSTVTVLDHLGDRLVPGSVVLFDEYFNYPGWEAHEHRAWTEFVERTGVRFEYLCYTSNNEQLAVRITRGHIASSDQNSSANIAAARVAPSTGTGR